MANFSDSTKSRITLYVSIARGRGMPFHFDLDRVSIGRGEDMDLRLDRPTVSRFHAAIEKRADGSFELVPSSRTNPTRLNGAETSGRTLLEPEDVIGVGDVEIAVEVHREVETPAPAGHYDALDQLRGRAPIKTPDPSLVRHRAARPSPSRPARSGKPQKWWAMAGALAAVLVLVPLAWYTLRAPSEGDLENATATQKDVDILLPPRVSKCASPGECRDRAKRAFDRGVDLESRAAVDPANLYRAAWAMEEAAVLLDSEQLTMAEIPGLGEKRKTLRGKVEQEIREAKFRLANARKMKDKMRALRELDYMVRLIADEEHPYRKRVLAFRRRVASEP